MNKPTLWRRIVGGIKMYKSAFYLTIGTIMVPTGFIIFIDSKDIVISATAFILGMASLLMGNIELNKEESRNRKILNTQFENQRIIQSNAEIRHRELIKEIKKLRGGNDDKPTDHFQSVL